MIPKEQRRWLTQLTALPTAAGREDRVIAWVLRWAQQRPALRVRRDKYGNILLLGPARRGRPPLVFEAHLDHPAFVVSQVRGQHDLTADFRGRVEASFFRGSRVLWRAENRSPLRGQVTAFEPPRAGRLDPRVTVRLERPADVHPGDVLTWDTGSARVVGGRLRTLGCDNLAGVAAALAALDTLQKRPKGPDVRVLLTRAEEVGFIGAVGACRSGILPKGSTIVVLEASKSMPDSPLEAGPIVRVGDKTSTFSPRVTYVLGALAQKLAARDRTFRWQRKLMPGGTCNASAYQSLGYAAGCVCLPLKNYHNMNARTGRIAPEEIALSDWQGLVRLLVEVGSAWGSAARVPTFEHRVRELFRRRRALLNGTSPR